MTSESLTPWLAALSQKTPVPGGGALASALSAQAVALFAMVARYSKGPRFGSALIDRLDREQGEFLVLAEDDARAFQNLSDTLKSVKKGIATEALLQSRFMAAARPPLIAFEKTLDISETLLSVAEHTNRNLKTDTLMVADLLCCALRSHRLNVDVNLAGTNNPDFIDRAAKRLAAGQETLSALERLRDTF